MAITDTVWTRGAGTNVWTTAGNWSNGVPVAESNILFQPIGVALPDSGLDVGGIDANALIISKGVTGDLGSSGNELKIAANLVHHMGSGQLFYQHAQNAGAALDTDLIIIDAENPTTAVEISNEESDNDGIAHIVVLRGTVTIDATNGNMPRLSVGFRTNPNTDAIVNYPTDTPTLAKLVQTGGRLTCNVPITDAFLTGGRCIQDNNAIANLIMHGGYMDYRDDGAITLADIHGGTFDLMQDPVALTVSTGIWHPGSVIHKNTTLHTITSEQDLRTESP